jgi:hypothetical protein
MLHSVLAVLAGYVTMVIIVIIGTVLAVRFILHRPPAELRASHPLPMPSAYLTANLLMSGLAALAGGCVTASFAATSPLGHGIALAVFIAVMSLLSMKQAGASQPRWYQIVLATVMPALAVVGAWLWMVRTAAK